MQSKQDTTYTCPDEPDRTCIGNRLVETLTVGGPMAAWS